MTALGALVVILAVSWVGAYPNVPLADFPENARGGISRIVSGWEAVEGQFPYQLSLRMIAPEGSVFGCGATLIHNEWALTAAHCTARRVSIIIRFGGIDLTRPELILETTDYYNHPLYLEILSGIVQPHDIGLIRLNTYVQYTNNIQPIRIQRDADKNNNYDKTKLQASGWGRTWSDGPSPQILNWVYLVGVTNEFCRTVFSSIVIDSTICADAYNVSSQSTCQGDSGGPLVVRDQDGGITQVGISSFVARAGCHVPLPAGFIRPGHYHSWFTEVTGINFDWDFSESTIAPTTTEEVTTEEVTTEEGTTEEGTTEEGTTEEGTTEEGTTEEGTTEEGTTEEGTTEEGTTEEGTTEEVTSEPTTTVSEEDDGNDEEQEE